VNAVIIPGGKPRVSPPLLRFSLVILWLNCLFILFFFQMNTIAIQQAKKAAAPPAAAAEK